ncbi:hypothetical protein BH23CHL4_BH23CHL4_27660 [soil metagenome]
MSHNDRDIIEIDDWRVVDDREVAAVDADEESAPHYANPVWVGEMRSAGPGCCFGLSMSMLILLIIFVLGLCAAFWLVLQALGWLVP